MKYFYNIKKENSGRILVLMHIHGYQLFRKMYRLEMQNQIARSAKVRITV